MSAKVTVICASRCRTYSLRRNLAERKVREGAFRWVNKFTIEEVPLTHAALKDAQQRLAYFSGPLGVGNALPFSRVQNPLKRPDPLHYPIPAAGAHTRPFHVYLINKSFPAATTCSAL